MVNLKLSDEQAEVLRHFISGRFQGVAATAAALGYGEGLPMATELLEVIGGAMPKEVDGPVPEELPPVVDEDISGTGAEVAVAPPTPEEGGVLGTLPGEKEEDKPEDKPKSGSRARQGVATSEDLKA